MLKKIKPSQVLKITKIDYNGYQRINFVPDSATVVHCVLKLKNMQELPSIDNVLTEAEIILTSDNDKELDSFSKEKWIKIDLILKEI